MTDFNLCPYEAIIFDLDSTLTNTKRYPLKASKWLLDRCSDTADELLESYIPELLENYRIGIESVVIGGPYLTPYKIVRRAIGKALSAVGIEYTQELLDEAISYFKQLHVDLSEPSPNVEGLLIALRAQDIKLGVFTNSFEGHAEIILNKIDLRKYFDVVADGGLARGFKPMSVVFDYTLSKLNKQPETTLFVGDEFHADIFGSISAGMNAVWINSRGRSIEDALQRFGESYRPRVTLDSVSELERYICS